jgi:hypothetical protein
MKYKGKSTGLILRKDFGALGEGEKGTKRNHRSFQVNRTPKKKRKGKVMP